MGTIRALFFVSAAVMVVGYGFYKIWWMIPGGIGMIGFGVAMLTIAYKSDRRRI